MKVVLSLLFILSVIFIKAQGSYYEGVVLADTITEKLLPNYKESNSLILMSRVMSKREIALVIKEKNNSELNHLMKKIKFAKMFQNIGFAAIPEAIVGGGLITVNSLASKNHIEQRNIGIGLVALSAVCLSSSLCFKFVQTKNYKKAIRKYNELYN